MPFTLNPFTGQFDYYKDIAAVNWMPSVPTEGDLPSSGNVPGDARTVQSTDSVYVWDDGSSRWVRQTIQLTTTGSTPNSSGQSIVADDSTANIRTNRLQLQPADATNPGVVSTTTQTFSGDKTFNDSILADGGIDVTSTGGTDTLSIGITNAEIINIGNAGASINLYGDTFYQEVTNLQVSDKTITINKNGATSSGFNAGLEVEENSSITGYVETSADRNSWDLKAPNTAGVATITPGVSGITLNQSSHDPLTLGSFGSSPNSSGATLSTQQLILQPADAINPGGVSTTTQTFAGNKTFSGTVTSNSVVVGSAANQISGLSTIVNSGTLTLPTSTDTLVGRATTDTLTNKTLSGNTATNLISGSGTFTFNTTGTITVPNATDTLVGKETTDTLTNKSINGLTNTITNVSLTTSVTGVLPIANGGTNLSSTPTNGQLLIGNGTGYTLTALSAGSGISISNGAGSISVAMTVPSSTGDISQTSFTALDNQASPQDVTGLAFANGSVRSFISQVSIVRDSTYAVYNLMGVQKASSWELSQDLTGDSTGITFSITNAGQVQYTSTSTGSNATLKFRASVTNV